MHSVRRRQMRPSHRPLRRHRHHHPALIVLPCTTPWAPGQRVEAGRARTHACILGQLDDAGHQGARSELLLSNRRLWLLWKLRRVHKSLLQRAQRSALPMHADAARTAGAAGPARSTGPD